MSEQRFNFWQFINEAHQAPATRFSYFEQELNDKTAINRNKKKENDAVIERNRHREEDLRYKLEHMPLTVHFLAFLCSLEMNSTLDAEYMRGKGEEKRDSNHSDEEDERGVGSEQSEKREVDKFKPLIDILRFNATKNFQNFPVLTDNERVYRRLQMMGDTILWLLANMDRKEPEPLYRIWSAQEPEDKKFCHQLLADLAQRKDTIQDKSTRKEEGKEAENQSMFEKLEQHIFAKLKEVAVLQVKEEDIKKELEKYPPQYKDEKLKKENLSIKHSWIMEKLTPLAFDKWLVEKKDIVSAKENKDALFEEHKSEFRPFISQTGGIILLENKDFKIWYIAQYKNLSSDYDEYTRFVRLSGEEISRTPFIVHADEELRHQDPTSSETITCPSLEEKNNKRIKEKVKKLAWRVEQFRRGPSMKKLKEFEKEFKDFNKEKKLKKIFMTFNSQIEFIHHPIHLKEGDGEKALTLKKQTTLLWDIYTELLINLIEYLLAIYKLQVTKEIANLASVEKPESENVISPTDPSEPLRSFIKDSYLNLMQLKKDEGIPHRYIDVKLKLVGTLWKEGELRKDNQNNAKLDERTAYRKNLNDRSKGKEKVNSQENPQETDIVTALREWGNEFKNADKKNLNTYRRMLEKIENNIKTTHEEYKEIELDTMNFIVRWSYKLEKLLQMFDVVQGIMGALNNWRKKEDISMESFAFAESVKRLPSSPPFHSLNK